MRAQFVFHEVWIGLRRNLTMTIALVVVVAISLSLLGTGLLFVKQVDNARSYWQGHVQLSVFLFSSQSFSPSCAKNGSVTTAEKDTIQQNLNGLKQYVSSATYVSQANAYKQFKQEFADSPTLVKYTAANQIPASFQIKLKNTEADATPVESVVDGYPGVAEVVNDASILDQFYKL